MKSKSTKSTATKLKMSIAHKGIPKSTAMRAKLSETWAMKRRMKNICSIDSLDENIIAEFLIDIENMEDSMIAKQIKTKYNVSVKRYNERIIDVTFALKTNADKWISVLLKRSDDSYAFVICSKDFADEYYVEEFKTIARSTKPESWNIKLEDEITLEEAREEYRRCNVAESRRK
jgi:hypothetical protein